MIISRNFLEEHNYSSIRELSVIFCCGNDYFSQFEYALPYMCSSKPCWNAMERYIRMPYNSNRKELKFTDSSE